MEYDFNFSKMIFIFTKMKLVFRPVAICKLFEMIHMLWKIRKGPVQIFSHSFDFSHYKILTVYLVNSGSLAGVIKI